MTFEDMKTVTFETARKGYRPEDVDDFLLQAANEMERLEAAHDAAVREQESIAARLNQLAADRDAAIHAKDDAEAKMYILATKVEEYRGQEETLKTALINAQRMGETVVMEAKQKAEQMLRDATGQSELLRQKAEEEAARERDVLARLIEEVNRFKSTVLNLYKQHIESLSALDVQVARAAKHSEKNSAEDVEKQGVKPVETPEPVHGNAEPEIPTKPLQDIPQHKSEQKRPNLFEGELIEE